MLTRKDLRLNISAYYALSTLNILPFQVSQNWDKTSETMSIKIKEQKSPWRLCIQRIWLVLIGLEILICAVNLLRLMMIPADTDQTYYFPFVFVTFCSFRCSFVENIIISWQWPDLNTKIMQQVFSGLENSSKIGTRTGTGMSPITKLFIIYLPFVFLNVELAAIAFFVYDPLLPTSTYSILHHIPIFSGQTWAITKWGCLVLHCVLFAPFLSTVCHLLFLTLSFIHHLSCRIDDIMINIMTCPKNSARNSWKTHQMFAKMCRQIRSLQLLTNYFNLCFSTMLFLAKICLMSGAVILGYLAIHYFHSEPIVALANLLLAVDLNAMFVIAFDKAFVVPDKSNEVNRQLKSVSSSLYRKYTRDLVRAEIKSLKISGIKVGQFRTLERESTPNFIDFVITQIVALLVM